MALGFIWQGAPLIRHYAVAVIPPLFLMLAAVMAWAWPQARALPRMWAAIAPAVLIIGTAPAVGNVLWAAGAVSGYSPGRLIAAAQNLENRENLEVFRRISGATAPEDCIQVAYGWSASAYYWYSEREPCARFIVPPLDLSEELSDEYQQRLIDNPPQLLVFDEDLSTETTVDPERGTADTTIFPFRQVVRSCYRPLGDSPILYVPLEGEGRSSSQCIREQVSAMLKGEP